MEKKKNVLIWLHAGRIDCLFEYFGCVRVCEWPITWSLSNTETHVQKKNQTSFCFFYFALVVEIFLGPLDPINLKVQDHSVWLGNSKKTSLRSDDCIKEKRKRQTRKTSLIVHTDRWNVTFFPFFPPLKNKININQKWQLYNLLKKVLDEKKLRRRQQLIWVIQVIHFFLTAQVGYCRELLLLLLLFALWRLHIVEWTVCGMEKKRKWLRGQCAFDRAGAIHYGDDDVMAVRSQIHDIPFVSLPYRARSLCGLSFFTMLLKRITLLLSKSLSTSLPFPFFYHIFFRSFLFYFYFLFLRTPPRRWPPQSWRRRRDDFHSSTEM